MAGDEKVWTTTHDSDDIASRTDTGTAEQELGSEYLNTGYESVCGYGGFDIVGFARCNCASI